MIYFYINDLLVSIKINKFTNVTAKLTQRKFTYMDKKNTNSNLLNKIGVGRSERNCR